MPLHRGGAGPRKARHRHREYRQAQAARDIDQIGDHGARGRARARATALEQCLADEIAFRHHGVEDALDMGDRRIERHHARMHALLDAMLGLARQTKQLDAVAELGGVGDIERGDVADAFDVHALEIDRTAEGDAGQDRQLVRRVDAVDVEARIGLSVAVRLRLGQHVGEVAAAFAHGRQDVVAGAVEDAVKARDAVADQPFPQRLDDRNAASDGRLVAQRHPRLLRRRRQRRAMMRQQRLVGGDDVLAGGDGRLDHLPRHAVAAADQFDDDVDVIVARQRRRIVMPGHAGKVDAAIALAVAGADRNDRQLAAATQRQHVALLGQQANDAGADCAEAGDSDTHRLHPTKRRP